MSDQAAVSTPVLGVCYYPEHWPADRWQHDAEKMRQLGIGAVRIGEFAWRRIEPRAGVYDWDWLDTAVEVLANAGLKIIMGTPTACPPQWLIDAHPDILARDANGRVRGFGSRRHYCFSSPVYREHSARIIEVMARRYADHPAISAWQTDNEYGCHDTVLSYSEAAIWAFRVWLQKRYGDIQSLNAAWGNVFWSMEYTSFSAIDAPVGAVTETNPAHRLAYQRFSSDQVAEYNRLQVRVLRKAGVNVDLMHNYMGCFTQFDHYAVAADLQVAAWDSYPLGFLEQSAAPDTRKACYRQQGDPDFAGFHHDLYRAVGNGRLWVIEQQPGQVNWAPTNAAPLPGMVRLWLIEAMAHGAELASIFRWRQAPFAQEQHHAAVLLSDSSEAPAAPEVQQAAQDIAAIDWRLTARAPVALVFDYEAVWVTEIQPLAEHFSVLDEAMRWYRCVRKLGLDVDIVKPGADLTGYELVLMPCQPIVSEALLQALRSSDAALLIGARSGSKTAEYQTPTDDAAALAPGPLQALIDVQVTAVDAIRAGCGFDVDDHPDAVHTWLEQIRSKLTPLRTTVNGAGVHYAQGRVHYVAAQLADTLLQSLIRELLEPRVNCLDLPPGVRVRRRGAVLFAFNYANSERTIAGLDDYTPILGGEVLPPAGVSVFEAPSSHE